MRAEAPARNGPRSLPGLLPAAVSGAALGSTGEIAAPVLLVFAGALAVAAGAAVRGHGGVRSGPVLNAALAGVVAVCLLLAAAGAHPLVVLAHFTLLAGALLLLDARPRRSEYPLVSLALFQIVLTSSLTDSLLFPLLLAGFLLALVFSLASHTLERAAHEAGLPAPPPALRRGLLRPTLRASAVALAVTAILFALLPRLRAGAVLPGSLLGGPARSGLSERIELGDLGRIRRDPAVALRVEHVSGVPRPGPAYFRAIALDRFDGRAWSVTRRGRTAVAAGPGGKAVLLAAAGHPMRVERIVREPTPGGMLLLPRGALFLEGTLGRVDRDESGNLFAPRTAGRRIVYTVAEAAEPPDDRRLRLDRLAVPAGGEHLLDLPPLSPEVHALARRLAGEAASPLDADRARALERGLRRLGRYRDTPPALPAGDPRSPVEIFLTGELEGHCEYFATAMAVLARSLGMPARVVTGFAGGSRNRFGGFLELRRSDAHAWVELHYERAGWVRYDPTPPAALLPASGPPFMARLQELADALEHLWFRAVVELDRGDQMRAVAAARREARRLAAGFREHLPALAAAASVLLPGALLVAALRRRRSRRTEPLPPPYARALRLLERAGHPRPPGAAPRATVARLAPGLPPEAARALRRITDACLAHRYGERPLPDLDAELRRLRDSLRP